jgi:hypothetical protein
MLGGKYVFKKTFSSIHSLHNIWNVKYKHFSLLSSLKYTENMIHEGIVPCVFECGARVCVNVFACEYQILNELICFH